MVRKWPVQGCGRGLQYIGDGWTVVVSLGLYSVGFSRHRSVGVVSYSMALLFVHIFVLREL